MTTLMIIVLCLLGVVVLLAAIAIVARLVLRGMRGPLQARIAASYRPDQVRMQDLGANTFGLQSRGVLQGRGNGALVLTDETLHFFRFVPGADVRVPLAAITEVGFTRSHLGKSTIHDLLKVTFAGDAGPDAIAVYVADPRAWQAAIEEGRRGHATN